MEYPSWFFGIQIEQKFGLKCRIKLSELSSCFWANLFVELLLGLPNPLMPNKMSHLYQSDEPVWNQRAIK